MCQAIQTTPIQPELEQNAKAQKPRNHATSPTLPQDAKPPCQTLRMRELARFGLRLRGLVVGFAGTSLVYRGRVVCL